MTEWITNENKSGGFRRWRQFSLTYYEIIPHHNNKYILIHILHSPGESPFSFTVIKTASRSSGVSNGNHCRVKGSGAKKLRTFTQELCRCLVRFIGSLGTHPRCIVVYDYGLYEYQLAHTTLHNVPNYIWVTCDLTNSVYLESELLSDDLRSVKKWFSVTDSQKREKWSHSCVYSESPAASRVAMCCNVS